MRETVAPLAAAAQAMRAGRSQEALALLRDVAGPQADWLRASAYRNNGDRESEAAALRRILDREPNNVVALLALAEYTDWKGDKRSRLALLKTAIAHAAQTALQPSAAALVDKALVACRALEAELAEQFETVISAIGLDRPGISPALREAVALLRGETQIYLQEPSMFYYPGLPQRAWFERSEFEWIAAFESQATILAEELVAVLQRSGVFSPYIEWEPHRPKPSHDLLDDASWSAGHIWKNGVLDQAIAATAPATVAALASAAQPVVPGRSPMALWSRLRPGTHIKPHNGLLNTRLICHLPLIAPPDCALRVGSETRPWTFGEMLIFDDSIEHEAWNRSATDRTVLLFEIWRPEIGPDDRLALTRLFEAIDRVSPATQ